MSAHLGRLQQVKVIRSPKNQKLVVSFEVVDDNGQNRSLEAAHRIVQKNADGPITSIFEIGRTHGITERLDVLMIATEFPHMDTPMRLEMLYAPENNRKATSSTELEALLNVSEMLVSKHIVPQSDADDLRSRITCEIESGRAS
jgi:hypothetical protein